MNPPLPQRLLRPAVVVFLGAALAAGLAACGSSGGASAAASASSPAASSPPGTIVIKEFAFHPSHLRVRAGSTVTVHNEDSVTHTVTALDGKFNTGDIAPGQTVTFRVDAPGTYPYYCLIHQFMHGTLTVTG